MSTIIEPTSPATPAPNRESVEVLQQQLATLIGPIADQFIDSGEALLIGVVCISANGGRRSILYLPGVNEDMTMEQKVIAEEGRAVGQFQAAIQFGKLHAALSDVTNQALRTSVRPR